MTRYDSLRRWMRENCVTFRFVGQQLGISGPGVRALLTADRIPPARHAQLLALHFPAELLPRPEEYKHPGRPRMVPVWLAEGSQPCPADAVTPA